MKNMILTAILLSLTVTFTGCSSCCAQTAKTQKQTKAPAPQAILIIDEVAYIDGCDGCDCVEEDVCVCDAKADCECCRKHLKKAPKEMQEKCKAMKKTHGKKAAGCKDGGKESDGTSAACNLPSGKNDGKKGK